ncbi:FMN-binding protein [Kitasatospora sp. NBC_01287]|uniref:FMN-binding protein n=1 Tax=Kitasatospora sp. NBC_01287 TaxID=2903573 RepID=UPI002253F565|nr:FMN-binding protein [Kitasatospora sp. NBC_01287]MCX4746307.1 FMN-binding protein [Kitasatospora sp. NBC_01287]
MRRTIVTTAATAAGIVLLLSLKPHGSASAQSGPVISSDTGTTVPADEPSSAPSSAPSGAPSGAPSSSPSGSPSAASGSAATRTVTGSPVDTRYGPVQVRVTLTGGKLSKVDVLQYPSETNRDLEINTFALPQLNQEAIAAGSAQIDSVSGATYTSEGYTRSLQSALDQAGAH